MAWLHRGEEIMYYELSPKERKDRERIKRELEQEIKELTSDITGIEEEIRKKDIRLRGLGGLKLAAENNKNESEIERLKEKIRREEEEKRDEKETLNNIIKRRRCKRERLKEIKEELED